MPLTPNEAFYFMSTEINEALLEAKSEFKVTEFIEGVCAPFHYGVEIELNDPKQGKEEILLLSPASDKQASMSKWQILGTRSLAQANSKIVGYLEANPRRTIFMPLYFGKHLIWKLLLVRKEAAYLYDPQHLPGVDHLNQQDLIKKTFVAPFPPLHKEFLGLVERRHTGFSGHYIAHIAKDLVLQRSDPLHTRYSSIGLDQLKARFEQLRQAKESKDTRLITFDEDDSKLFVSPSADSSSSSLTHNVVLMRLTQEQVAKRKMRVNEVNVTDQFGNTPLHYAVLQRNIPGLIKLLRRGANMDALNVYHLRPHDMLAFLPRQASAILNHTQVIYTLDKSFFNSTVDKTVMDLFQGLGLHKYLVQVDRFVNIHEIFSYLETLLPADDQFHRQNSFSIFYAKLAYQVLEIDEFSLEIRNRLRQELMDLLNPLLHFYRTRLNPGGNAVLVPEDIIKQLSEGVEVLSVFEENKPPVLMFHPDPVSAEEDSLRSSLKRLN